MAINVQFVNVEKQRNSQTTFQKTTERTSSLLYSADTPQHLVLDLDETLVSSFEFGPVSSSKSRKVINTVRPILTNEYKDEYGLPELYDVTIANVVVLVKLRPYVRRFIKNASEQGYLLHIYTKAKRNYTDTVIRLVDPEGIYIKGRTISRDDDPACSRDSQKNPSLINESFGAGKKVPFVVMDDSPSVWSSCASYAEVIPARRYTFSDRFVQYLQSVGRSKTAAYPVDSDVYLSTVLARHLSGGSGSSSRSLLDSVDTACTSDDETGGDETECASISVVKQSIVYQGKTTICPGKSC